MPFRSGMTEDRRKLEIISDSIHLGTWEFDPATANLVYDDNLYALYGYANRTSVSPAVVWEQCVPPEERVRVHRETELAMQTHGEIITRFKIVTPAGQVRYIANRGVAYDKGDGTTPKMHGVTWDVTVEETIRRETLRQQRELEVVLASMYEGLVIHDPQGCVVRFNKALLKLMCISESELLALPLSDYRWMGVKKDGSTFTSEDHPIECTLRTGEPQLNVLMGLCLGGELTWLSVTSTPIMKTDDTSPHWVMTTFVDITELREAEQTLAKRSIELEIEKLKFEGFVKALNQTALVSVMDADARVIFVNEMFLSYMVADEQIILRARHPLFAMMNDAIEEELWKELRHALDEGHVWHGIVHTEGRDKRELWLDTSVVPIGDKQRGTYEAYVLQIDVTDQKRLEKQLSVSRKAEKDANAAKSIFLATMSHEMRTPLNGVIGMCSLLTESELAEEHQQQVETITSCARALLSLIDHILDLSEIEACKMELSLSEINLCPYLLELVRSQQYAADQKHIYLRSELPSTSLILYADHAKLGQVVRNLLSNAIKFTSEGGVTMTCAIHELPDGQHMELHIGVTDTGIGVSTTAQQRLFQSFTQADTSVRQRFGGTGLGLSICKGLINLMGGKITLESEVGVGSTFSFVIPLRKAGEGGAIAGSASSSPEGSTPALASPSLRQPQAAMVPMSHQGARILVAEDNGVNQKVIGAMLKKLGLQYDIAENGYLATQALNEGNYSLVLMDCEMPVMDGYQATHYIRNHDNAKLRSIPVIALTANAISGAEEECLRAGMDDYITKPITVQRLALTLKKYLTVGA